MTIGSITFLSLSLFYLTFTLWVRYGISRLRKLPVKPLAELPTVSVLVPAKNEEANISRTLKSLENQSYPRSKFTVIMINDRSTDATGSIMKDFTLRNDNFRLLEIRHLPSGIAPKKHALQTAIAQAESEIM
jgi:cellulose synthase/poly-beta-1,6-N-acetylglucosamine synthase-like glycosyltransferase